MSLIGWKFGAVFLLQSLAGFATLATVAASSPVLAQDDFDLGRVWQVTEYAANGRYWEGEWVRRGDSDVFDATWRDSLTGGLVRDVIEFRHFRQGRVVLNRYGNHGRYFGELSEDGRHIEHGSASWYGPGDYWTARIRHHRRED